MGNVRDVGAVVAYHLTGCLPLVLEAGLFNPNRSLAL